MADLFEEIQNIASRQQRTDFSPLISEDKENAMRSQFY